MRKVFTILAATMVAGVASAQEAPAPTVVMPVVSGEVSLDFAETTGGSIGGTMGLDLGIDAGDIAYIDLGLSATDGNAVTLDNWEVGTELGGVGVALGDDINLFSEAEDGSTLSAPGGAESVRVTVGGAAVAVGLTDWTDDITDFSNVQGSYTVGDVSELSAVTVAAEMDLADDTLLLGASAGYGWNDIGITGHLTWEEDGYNSDTTDATVMGDLIGYEVVASLGSLTGYVNGNDQSIDAADVEWIQNIGASYEYELGGATFTAGANYDMIAEELAPTAGISFSF